MQAAQTETAKIIERHDRFMSLNYPRYPIAMVRGDGCRLYDSDGRSYLDLFAGFGATILGHCHDGLVAAVTAQAERLWHVGNLLHTDAQTRAAEAIANHGFAGRSFFCHSGADANEAAIKLARLHGHAHPGPKGQRFKVVSATRSFHGRTFGTMPATGDAKVQEGFGPMAPGFVHVPYNDADAAEHAIDDETAAVLIEPIQGEGGIHVPDDDYLPKLRRLCDRSNTLLICDEVWTGCGRTGRYFAHQHWNVEPDIMTLGKGVGGGMAVGVMCARSNVAELYDTSRAGVKHASTLGGNCLAMAVTSAIFEALEKDRLVERAASLGDHASDRLRRAAREHTAIRQVRGRGLFIGIELDPANAWFSDVTEVVNRCRAEGVLVNGTQQTVLRLAPPLVITRAELDEGLDVIERIVAGD